MFPTRRARTPLALLPLGLLAALTGGCGGASTPRTTLPAEELVVSHADARATRSWPGAWTWVSCAPPRTGPS
jgi:hypothetical protein